LSRSFPNMSTISIVHLIRVFSEKNLVQESCKLPSVQDLVESAPRGIGWDIGASLSSGSPLAGSRLRFALARLTWRPLSSHKKLLRFMCTALRHQSSDKVDSQHCHVDYRLRLMPFHLF
jgi:hypothetical protein